MAPIPVPSGTPTIDYPDPVDEARLLLASCTDLYDQLLRTEQVDHDELTDRMDDINFLLAEVDGALLDDEFEDAASDVLSDCAVRLAEIAVVRADNVLELCELPLWSTASCCAVLRAAAAAAAEGADPCLLAMAVRTIPISPFGDALQSLPGAARRAVLAYRLGIRDQQALTGVLERWEALDADTRRTAEALAADWDTPTDDFLDAALRVSATT